MLTRNRSEENKVRYKVPKRTPLQKHSGSLLAERGSNLGEDLERQR